MHIIFDEFGTPYEVEEMEEMAQEMNAQEMEELYKSSSYFLRYTEYLYKLNDEGKVKLPTKKFETSQISSAIDIIGKRIESALGTETREAWDLEVDKQWQENKDS